MNRLNLLLCLGLSAVLISACVSKSKYLDLESDLVETRRQAEVRAKDLEGLQQKYNALEAENRELQNRIALQETESTRLASLTADLKTRLHEQRTELEEKEQVIQQLVTTRRQIEDSLKDQIASQQIKIEEMAGRLKVTFVDKILFDSGSAEINPRGKELLSNFADSFKSSTDQNITVEGHTDNVGVGPRLQQRFPTNWELSTARATAVVRFLQDEAGLPPERLSAVGYSQYQPLASNDTEEGRSRNRRIEIILVPVQS
jgi:chemotaxis protein MotB